MRHGKRKMQIVITGLLAIVIVMTGCAVYLWRKRGWRKARQWIVMLIVLAAALQMVNVVLMMNAQRLSG